MTNQKHKRIFISYNKRDHAKVDLLRSQLIEQIHNVSVVELGATGKAPHYEIAEQLNTSSMVLLFLGDEGISRWQELEINIAKTRNIPIVGVSSSIGLVNKHSSFFDPMEGPNFQWTFDKLRRLLRGEDQSLSYEPLEPKRLESPIIRIDFETISRELTNYLIKNPDQLHSLSPRKFEYLVAYLLENHGYEVTLTQKSRDGGVDIFALHKDDLGNFLTLVECKKFAPNRPVGVGVVRSLYGVLNVLNASHGVIATTSTFTAGAKIMAMQYQYQLSLKDHADIST